MVYEVLALDKESQFQPAQPTAVEDSSVSRFAKPNICLFVRARITTVKVSDVAVALESIITHCDTQLVACKVLVMYFALGQVSVCLCMHGEISRQSRRRRDPL